MAAIADVGKARLLTADGDFEPLCQLGLDIQIIETSVCVPWLRVTPPEKLPARDSRLPSRLSSPSRPEARHQELCVDETNFAAAIHYHEMKTVTERLWARRETPPLAVPMPSLFTE